MILLKLVKDHGIELGGQEKYKLVFRWKELEPNRLNGSDIQNAFNTALRMAEANRENPWDIANPNSFWGEYFNTSLHLQIERQIYLTDIRGDDREYAHAKPWR
ncbi:hypothetical protein BJY01DRAFT_54805 [Aspergillus pseudoustus]|uniref:Uncharacterized protein n=1 Tax=Aspergillus pseudoustus TaxID=1810923 RepID=A0ABR4JBV7_9EURO